MLLLVSILGLFIENPELVGNRQFLPSFFLAVLEYAFAARRGHPRTETKSLQSSSLFWLVCSLWHSRWEFITELAYSQTNREEITGPASS
jgi:hypothetical protein